MQTTDPIKSIDRAFDAMKAHKAQRESEFQLIADHFLPRKDFSLGQRAGDLRRRRLTSSVPAVALRNSAAMLFSYLVDPTNPFILPNVENSLVRAGMSTQLSGRPRDFLDNVRWGIHTRMMRPKSGFLTSGARLGIELWAFGTGVQWIGHKRGYGPVYQSRPFRSCWLRTNGDGEVDTLYYEFEAPLHWVLQRFDLARYVDKWANADETKLRENVTILHCVEPRQGGIKGAEKHRKPFAERYVCLEQKAVLEENGYNSFPYAVPRLEPENGSDYGTGRCWYALPDAIGLSTLQQGIENGVDLKVAPPVLQPRRMFGKPLDRRPGAVNTYDPGQLGFMEANKAFQRLDVAGDIGVGLQYHDRLIQNVEGAMGVDWMRLRDSGNVTAEEIIERRNLRVGVMSAQVPGIDREWMGPVAERTAEIMLAEGDLGYVPDELAGAEIEWDYAGPLARASMQRQAEAFDRMFVRLEKAMQIDPRAPLVIDLMEGLRACAEAEGMPVGTLRAREDVERLEAEAEEREAQMQELNAAQMAAGALRDGAQGMASLANAGQPQAMAA